MSALLNEPQIHTSAIAMDHALLDLCERPEYLEPIREEITGALASTQGVWTLETLSKLSKMDSFMQESRRWSHPAARKLSSSCACDTNSC